MAVNSLGEATLKHIPEHAPAFKIEETSYGAPVPLSSGLNSVKSQLVQSHPLESISQHFLDDQININNSIMMRAQGPAGPMIHAMERKAASKVGHLPFLPSSNFQLDILTGKDMELDFDDILNIAEFKETQAMPHVVMETLSPKF